MGKVNIASIGISVPEYKVSQEKYLKYVLNTPGILSENERLLRAICFKSGINERYSVLSDFSESEPQTITETLVKSAGISKRMGIFKEKALNLAISAVKDCLGKATAVKSESITHIISFSCTGMYAPGIEMEIIEEFGFSQNMERTCINFMGCYAAIIALKNAYHIVRSQPESIVLLVGVELCSIHHGTKEEPEQMVANAIFGDGAAAVLVTGKSIELKNRHLEIINFHATFSPSAKKEMTWRIGDHSFELYLSSYIPKLLNLEMGKLTSQLMAKAGLTTKEIEFYAIHPGGMAILKACEKALSLSEKDNFHAYNVLKKYGNMSSVTILFVLNELMNSLMDSDQGKNILSFAFGPGLTMESMFLKVGK
jgi:alpha-pyrone synthase